MQFKQHYSSSAGNLYTVTTSNGRRLLLECGVRWKLILESLEYNLKGIEGCFITHEHKDHCQAHAYVTSAGIDLYSDKETLRILGIEGKRRAIPMPVGGIIELDSFKVMSFYVEHDAVRPIGFVIYEKETGEHLLFSVDSQFLRTRFKIAFDIIAIECSYDIDVLQARLDSGDIHEALAKRLLDSHAEKKVTMMYLDEVCDLSKCREIHLLHMGNIVKAKAKKEFEQKFFIKTVVI